MSARSIIAQGACRKDANKIDTADAILLALKAAGYRILAPGEMDRETLEKAAKVAESHIIALSDDMCDDEWWVIRTTNRRSRRIAAAIRALGGGEG